MPNYPVGNKNDANSNQNSGGSRGGPLSPLPGPHPRPFFQYPMKNEINSKKNPEAIPRGNSFDVASDVGVNFKNGGVLSIESSLFHLFHYTFLQTKHQRKGY